MNDFLMEISIIITNQATEKYDNADIHYLYRVGLH